MGTMSLNNVTPITENTSMIITSNNTIFAMSVKRRDHAIELQCMCYLQRVLQINYDSIVYGDR